MGRRKENRDTIFEYRISKTTLIVSWVTLLSRRDNRFRYQLAIVTNLPQNHRQTNRSSISLRFRKKIHRLLDGWIEY